MPLVKYFDIVREVIDTNITRIAASKGLTPAQVYLQVVQHIRQNSAEWTSNKKPVIPYNNPLCRIAYLYSNVPANANLFEHVLRYDPELAKYITLVLASKGSLGLCAFGGGPGTELLGMAKWAEYNKYPTQVDIEFLLLDRVNEWLDSWMAIKNVISGRYQKAYGNAKSSWPLLISAGVFSAVDVTNITGFGNLGAIFQQDLYVMCYVISEVFDQTQDLGTFTSLMATHAPQGSKFLFIDRWGKIWTDKIKTIADQAGLALSDFHSTRCAMSRDELVTDLGQLHTDIGISPRTTWKPFWVVGTKC